MASRSGNHRIVLALGLSASVHALILFAAPNPLATPPEEAKRTGVTVRLVDSSIREPPPKERDIELGLDVPSPPSMTWLGFTEFVEQRARKSETDQAAFTDDPVAARSVPQSPLASGSQVPQTEARIHTARIHTDGEAVGSPDQRPRTESPETKVSTGGEDEPEHESRPAANDAIEPVEAAATSIVQPVIDSAISSESEAAGANANEQRVEVDGTSVASALRALVKFAQQAQVVLDADNRSATDQAQAEVSEAVAPRPESGADNQGARSDRESDPTSIIDVPREQWQLGKPLAAQGLEIKPRRPDIPILTSLTAWPANPLCRIDFDRRGVPTRAQIARSTGDSRIDAAIEASLYRWRAAGRQLDELSDQQTVTLTIRLVINPTRKQDDDIESH